MSSERASAPAAEGPTCHDCGEPHWYNVWVPDDVWARICPVQPFADDQQGGVLCARCIDRRCVETGITGVEARFFFTGQAVRASPAGTETLREALEGAGLSWVDVERLRHASRDPNDHVLSARIAILLVEAGIEAPRAALTEPTPRGSRSTTEGP